MSAVTVYELEKFVDVNRRFRKKLGFDMQPGTDIPREVSVRTTRLELARVMDYECCHCGAPIRVLLQPHPNCTTAFDCTECNAFNIVNFDPAVDYISVLCSSRNAAMEVQA
jgi:hypothetical protein